MSGPPGRHRAVLVLGVVAVTSLVTGATAGDESGVVRGESASLLEKRLRPGSESTEARVRSPRGGSPFGVALSRTEDGLSCVSLGRVKGGRVVIPARGAPDLPATEVKAGLCHRVEDLADSAPVVWDKQWRFYDEETGARETTTRFFGMVKPGVKRLVLRTDGQSVELPLSRGTFVVAFSGVAFEEGFELDAELAGGERTTMREPPLDPVFGATLNNPPRGSRSGGSGHAHP